MRRFHLGTLVEHNGKVSKVLAVRNHKEELVLEGFERVSFSDVRLLEGIGGGMDGGTTAQPEVYFGNQSDRLYSDPDQGPQDPQAVKPKVKIQKFTETSLGTGADDYSTVLDNPLDLKNRPTVKEAVGSDTKGTSAHTTRKVKPNDDLQANTRLALRRRIHTLRDLKKTASIQDKITLDQNIANSVKSLNLNDENLALMNTDQGMNSYPYNQAIMTKAEPYYMKEDLDSLIERVLLGPESAEVYAKETPGQNEEQSRLQVHPMSVSGQTRKEDYVGPTYDGRLFGAPGSAGGLDGSGGGQWSVPVTEDKELHKWAMKEETQKKFKEKYGDLAEEEFKRQVIRMDSLVKSKKFAELPRKAKYEEIDDPGDTEKGLPFGNGTSLGKGLPKDQDII